MTYDYNKPRYTVDRVGEVDWVIFDGVRGMDQPQYLLWLTHANNRRFTHQLTIAAFTPKDAYDVPYLVFNEEIYSVTFYSDPEVLGSLVVEVVTQLQYLDIRNPVELSSMFGGFVKSVAVVPSGIRPRSH